MWGGTRRGDEIVHPSLGAELPVFTQDRAVSIGVKVKVNSKSGHSQQDRLGWLGGVGSHECRQHRASSSFGHVVIVLASGLPERRILR